MPLTQLECSVDEAIAEELSSFLEEEALSLTWYEKKPEQWVFQAVYQPSSEETLKKQMLRFFKEKDLPLPSITSRPVPQEDWVAAVYRDSPPLTIGRFYIYGSHIQNDPPTGLIPLRVDAATAFGSGQHESTEGCLRALTLLTEHQSFHHPLDMGCGSGILALAMAHLWKTPVLACDNDPECVRVTLENARLNHLEDFLTAQLSEGFTSLKGKTFDIITANILAGPLCHMAGEASKALKPGGYIVLAGLLNRQAEDVIDAYRSAGIKLVDQLFIGDWSTLIMRK
ncbi:MAG: 50S ribosomal protein L11 methyltransferase [Proteobacteria bacterium]|nr:50S ribosomal protein L11 methyltransferase [Pseudomonadota bacterium]